MEHVERDPHGGGMILRETIVDADVQENLHRIRKRIEAAAKRADRDPKEIKLVAVSKGVDSARIRETLAAGTIILGENRLQEALPKIHFLEADVRWHFIGHLQTNKVKQAVGTFELIHSIDSLRLAQEVSTCAGQLGIRQPVLVQLNLSGEKSKFGLAARELKAVIREMAGLPGIAIRGLMTIPPMSSNPEAGRHYFRSLRLLAAEVSQYDLRDVGMEELSMGMSDDFEVAIEEGATLVRIGTAIFGQRRDR
jgi:pyridoxal phosphate enzyme (YggS family)